ncbi:hypothetical protein KC573_00390, partial [candidate division WWE3 bacterium]|nr:hypothetical protein [candidate division WWE3 bacterium]
ARLREEQVSVAVAYTSYIETVIATSDDSFPWIRVGGWEIVEANLLARHTVHFYAMRDDEVEILKESLREFNPSLPPSVSAVIYN